MFVKALIFVVEGVSAHETMMVPCFDLVLRSSESGGHFRERQQPFGPEPIVTGPQSVATLNARNGTSTKPESFTGIKATLIQGCCNLGEGEVIKKAIDFGNHFRACHA